MSDNKVEEEFKRDLLNHVGAKTKNFCAGVLCLGLVLHFLGFNISGPINRMANAWAEKFEIQAERLRDYSGDDGYSQIHERLEELEELSHSSTSSP